MSFSLSVKKLVESSFPNHKLIKTRKGPGPELRFQIGNIIDDIIKETLLIYKSNWDKSFYIHFEIILEITTKGNNQFQLSYSYVRMGQDTDKNLSASNKYENDKDILNIILNRKEQILKSEEAFFKSKRARYAEISEFFSNLPASYKKWHDVKSTFNYDKKMLEGLINEWLETPRGKELGRQKGLEEFDRKGYYEFLCYLIMNNPSNKKLLNEICIWQFWTMGRPLIKSEFIKNDYYYCIRCGKFLSRGDYVKCYDNIFGEYYEFVCAKCLKKENQQ